MLPLEPIDLLTTSVGTRTNVRIDAAFKRADIPAPALSGKAESWFGSGAVTSRSGVDD